MSAKLVRVPLAVLLGTVVFLSAGCSGGGGCEGSGCAQTPSSGSDEPLADPGEDLDDTAGASPLGTVPDAAGPGEHGTTPVAGAEAEAEAVPTVATPTRLELPADAHPSPLTAGLPPVVERLDIVDANAVAMPREPRVPVDDPQFGTRLVLLPRSEVDEAGDPVVHEYSRRQAWNVDETLMIVGGRLMDGRTLRYRDIGRPFSSAWNWSNLRRNLVYTVRFVENRATHFGYVDVDSGAFTLLHDFPGFRECRFGEGEGRLSDDDRRVAITCKRDDRSRRLFVLDIASGDVLGEREIDASLNWASVTPSGDHVVAEYSSDIAAERELVRFDPSLTERVLIGTGVEHGDLGRDAAGDEVFVMLERSGVRGIRIRDGASIASTPGSIAGEPGFGHVSCRARFLPGRCWLSSNSDKWIAAMRLQTMRDRDGALRFAPAYEAWGAHRSTAFAYVAEPKVTVSPSGRQVLFTSDGYGNRRIADYVAVPDRAEVPWRGCGDALDCL